MAVRIMFDIDESNIPKVLTLMGRYMQGPAIIAVIEGDAEPEPEPEPAESPIDRRKLRDAFLGKGAGKRAEPEPGNQNGTALENALEVLREAGSKGLSAGAFHRIMVGRGVVKQSSYAAIHNAKSRGLARKAKNGRLFITRSGNAAQ